jgi:hypothetical protein
MNVEHSCKIRGHSIMESGGWLALTPIVLIGGMDKDSHQIKIF